MSSCLMLHAGFSRRSGLYGLNDQAKSREFSERSGWTALGTPDSLTEGGTDEDRQTEVHATG